jgi:Fe2+ or Zn2+ uptake regulation protein
LSITDRRYIDWAWGQSLRNHEKIMLMDFAFRSNDDGDVNIGTIVGLAQQMGVSRVSVYRSLNVLIDKGLVTRDNQTLQLNLSASANCAAA